MTDPHRDQPVIARGASLRAAAGVAILLHGRGGSAADILELTEWLNLPALAYLAPEAAGRTWYPQSFLAPLEQNQPWLDSALALVGRIVDRAATSGVPKSRISFLGFSQGACLATEFVARSASPFGGLVAFTGGLIGPAGTRFDYPPLLAGMPVFLGAGDPDPHVPWSRVKETAAVLASLGADVSIQRYAGMPHTINADELDHAREILRRMIQTSGE